MRDLFKNMVSLWYLAPSSFTDEIDSDGFYTGEQIPTYGTPLEVRISLYPNNGDITERLFGKDASFDMVASSTLVKLSEDGLLFLEEPSEDFDTTYDYRIGRVNKSLNSFFYGLERRT